MTFILGGARSGKSRHAQIMAEAMAGQLIYIATAQPFDDEMADRIARHRRDRDDRWQTIDAPIELAAAVRTQGVSDNIVLVDCLTLWMSNIMLSGADVDAAIDELVEALRALPVPGIIVSNEVGLGIVPDNAMARQFRDHTGRLHQRIAEIADRVEWMVAGLSLRMK
ncbi:MAG: bifunctional adenosylcobinamide kinase/adenosylcobinamide-phosphate guanylyltransferase [Sphingomonas sp.]|nr:bifunctional adenosylcobinamide kinase/adenosylcobinamide-phosphate guanylyltransferase [Sphingomonas sp.]